LIEDQEQEERIVEGDQVQLAPVQRRRDLREERKVQRVEAGAERRKKSV
jgi:hypothetical protein